MLLNGVLEDKKAERDATLNRLYYKELKVYASFTDFQFVLCIVSLIPAFNNR